MTARYLEDYAVGQTFESAIASTRTASQRLPRRGCGNRHELYATASLGAEAFFHKPVRMKRLVEKAQELLGITLATADAG